MKNTFIVLFIVSILFISGCAQNQTQNNPANGLVTNNTNQNTEGTDLAAKIKNGDNIAVNYKGTLENGEEFDSSLKPGRTPLEFTVGAGQMIKGFDAAVVGMKVGEEKTITLQAKDGYGEKNNELVKFIPKEQFGEIFEKMEIGQQLQANNGMPVTVIDKNADGAKIDFNHFLAGKKLIFWIKIVSIN